MSRNELSGVMPRRTHLLKRHFLQIMRVPFWIRHLSSPLRHGYCLLQTTVRLKMARIWMKRIKKPEESSTRSTRKYSEVDSVSRLFTDEAISQCLKKQTEAFLRRITKVNGHSYLFLTRWIRRNRHAGCSYERGRKIDENQWIGLSYLPPEHKSHAPKQPMTAEKEIIPFGHHRSILQLLLHVKIYLCCLLFQQRGAIVDSDEIEYFYEFHYFDYRFLSSLKNVSGK